MNTLNKAIMIDESSATRVKAKAIFSIAIMVVILVSMGTSLAPEELSTLRINSPIYSGSQVVEVSGIYPKAEVTIFRNAIPIGGGKCHFDQCTFKLDEKVSSLKPDVITATQKVDGVESYPSEGVEIKDIPSEFRDPDYNGERLNPPSIEPPLYECSRCVSLSNILEGSQQAVYSDQIINPIGYSEGAWNYARTITTVELQKDHGITASQKIGEMKWSDPSEEKTVGPRQELEKPIVDKRYIKTGGDKVGVSNLVIGATVAIYYEDGTQIAGGIVRWPGMIFAVNPIKNKPGSNEPFGIYAEQSLCNGQFKARGSVEYGTNSLDSLIIDTPICPGSHAIRVCNAIPHAGGVRIFLKDPSGGSDKQIGQGGVGGGCCILDLGGKMQLKQGDNVYVIYEYAGLQSESRTFEVGNPSASPPEIANGISCNVLNEAPPSIPIFRRDTIDKQGPLFTVAKCGADGVVDIFGPDNQFLKTITLEQVEDMTGHFEGRWDWKHPSWNTNKEIPIGRYKAAFKIGGPAEDREFFVSGYDDCRDYYILEAHSKYRKDIGVSPLVWSDTIAGTAQQWADGLAINNPTGDPHENNCPYAENIYPGHFNNWKEVIDGWAEEKKCYDATKPDQYNGKCEDDPNCAQQTNKWNCVGHYSNIVNSGKKEVGCGMKGKWWVCRYG